MRALLLIVGLLWAPWATAQTTYGNSAIWGVGISQSGGSGRNAKDFRICLLPDMQNVVNTTAFAGVPNPETDCTTTGSGCVEPYCSKSPYCSVSWRRTADRFMENLAYELTGQWDKIDWTGVTGTDNVITKPGRALNQQPCNLILSLGDMTDVPNNFGYGDYIDNTNDQLTTLGYRPDMDTSLHFWSLINDSGVPYMLAQGNHDPWVWWEEYFTKLDIEGKSYFYQREPTWGLSYAILVPTALGKPVCVVQIGFSDTFYDAGAPGEATRGADVLAWATSVVGCAANYPTVLIAHSQVGEDGEPHTSGTVPQVVTLTGIAPGTYPGTAGASEIFMIAGGHHLSTDSEKVSYTGLFGVDADATVLGFYSNFQETLRHSTNAPYGQAEKESNGVWYTVVTIQPEQDRVCGHDWGIYWQTTQGGTANGQTAGIGTSAGCQTFDFDARFPP